MIMFSEQVLEYRTTCFENQLLKPLRQLHQMAPFQSTILTKSKYSGPNLIFSPKTSVLLENDNFAVKKGRALSQLLQGFEPGLQKLKVRPVRHNLGLESEIK